MKIIRENNLNWHFQHFKSWQLLDYYEDRKLNETRINEKIKHSI